MWAGRWDDPMGTSEMKVKLGACVGQIDKLKLMRAAC